MVLTLSPRKWWLLELNVLHSLLHLTYEISSHQPIQFLLKRNSSSIIRKMKLLNILLEELLRSSMPISSQSAKLCFEEMCVALQRFKTIFDDCYNGSKMWLLMQNESVLDSFHKVIADLSMLLDIFLVKELDLNNDVQELVLLIRKPCFESKPFVDPRDKEFRHEVLTMLDRIKREIVPVRRFTRENSTPPSTASDQMTRLSSLS